MGNSEPRRVGELFPVLATEGRSCDTHGPYTAKNVRVPGGRELWTDCPECDRERVEREDRKIMAEMRQQQQQRMNEQLIGRAAIPRRFTDRSLQNYNAENEGQRRALNAATRYAETWRENMEHGTSLIMCGNPGTGKTHLAVGIAKHIMADGGTAMFTRVIDMARTVKECYNRDAVKTERQVIADFARPDLLILDEVGHQHGSDTERMILFDVINARYEACRPIILITNLGLSGLREYLDERAQDRLREGGGRVIVFDWQSQRDKY